MSETATESSSQMHHASMDMSLLAPHQKAAVEQFLAYGQKMSFGKPDLLSCNQDDVASDDGEHTVLPAVDPPRPSLIEAVKARGMVAQVASQDAVKRVARPPEQYVIHATYLLKDLREELGTLYGVLRAVLIVSLIHQDAGATAKFVLPLWVVANIAGISRDRCKKILKQHARIFDRFAYHRGHASRYYGPRLPNDKTDDENAYRYTGMLWVVPIPKQPYAREFLGSERVKGRREWFLGVWRDLEGDIKRRFTDRGWRAQEGSTNARRGQSLSDAIPEGAALRLLERVIDDAFGTNAAQRAVELLTSRLRNVGDLIALVREGASGGKDGVRIWVRAVAHGLETHVARAADLRVWLGVAWGAHLIETYTREGGLQRLVLALEEFKSRLREGQILSHGGLLQALLQKHKFQELAEHARKLHRANIVI